MRYHLAMNKTVDVPDDVIPLIESRSAEFGMSVAAVLRYAIRRFALVQFPVEDEFLICQECRAGRHCEGKGAEILPDLQNLKRGMGRERRIRYVCPCPHCRQVLMAPYEPMPVFDQYGQVVKPSPAAELEEVASAVQG